MTTSLHVFLYGALAGLCAVAALFFARYWRTTRDRFFVFVASAFVGLGTSWASVAGTSAEEHAAYSYLPRLAGFVILLVGIVDKNRRASATPEA